MNENQPFLNANQRKYIKYIAIALFVLSMVLADVFGIQLPDLDGDPVESVYPEGWDEQAYSSSLETDTLFTSLATTGDMTVGGELNLASGAYPLGYATSGSQLVYGTSSITGTATAAHGLTTVTFANCTLGEDPTFGAGDGAMCTVAISANVVTVKVWQDDFVTAATETEVDVHWLVVGVP